MHLRITHETQYDYTPAVETAQHVAYLQPLDTPYQTLLSHRLDVSPAPAQMTQTDDIYGNRRAFFSLQTPHTQLRVVAISEVQTRAPEAIDSRISWEALREQFRYHSGAAWSAAAEFSFASARAPRHEAFAAYARPSFGAGVSALAGARDLMQRIHTDFIYETASTEVNTPPLEALAQRKGVCQDFAHIMLACLRSMGLAARYVSGYLLTQPAPGQPRLVGSDASHAWVSIFLPDLPRAQEGQGWYDLDPTNDRHGWGTPGEDYVTLATGRDYADISPIRGVIHGGGQHTLVVAVTVEPVEVAEGDSRA
jgi:transglutaminase-like putative cysteine protease